MSAPAIRALLQRYALYELDDAIPLDNGFTSRSELLEQLRAIDPTASDAGSDQDEVPRSSVDGSVADEDDDVDARPARVPFDISGLTGHPTVSAAGKGCVDMQKKRVRS